MSRRSELPVVENPLTWHESVDSDRVCEVVGSFDDYGLCIRCGDEVDGCEPDARAYTCPAGCGPYVYGAEELLLYLET